MGGIAGILTGGRAAPDELVAGVTAMTDALAHRGPEAADHWIDADGTAALGHCGLSIVDPSPMGAQPMVSSCGRYVLVYNGEVYNFAELRQALTQIGRSFRGRSDTEVLLEGIAAWGLEAALKRTIGMFALGLYDRQERLLFLARDRVGIKPLYWTDTGSSLLFASELKAIRSHPSFRPEINHDALAGFLRHGFIAAPKTIYRGVYKLAPGQILCTAPKGEPKISTYWRLADVVREATAHPFEGDEREAVEALDGLLHDAVRRHMIADVPIGALLNGKTGSALVAALMQAQSDKPVSTFSLQFANGGEDEMRQTRAVAQHLGTDHHELRLGEEDALAVVPKLAEMYDEPLADASQIHTYLISKFTRQSVTGALTGEGANALFGGYNRYIVADRYGRLLFGQPRTLRALEADVLSAMPAAAWTMLGKLLPPSQRPTQLAEKMKKVSGVLAGGVEEFYRNVTGHWEEPSAMVIGARQTPLPYDPRPAEEMLSGPVERMQYLDMISYLPDDVLASFDRASMAVSLELRLPLIDHRLVAFAWSLPRRFKIRGGRGKWILRQVLERHLPRELADRPQSDVQLPIGDWLRGPLRDWAEALLAESRLKASGHFKPEPVRRKWEEHLSGKRNWQQELWDVLMFQAWLERWK